ncbi:MAG TPA: hypothetical protein VN408_34765 [Actinoplanes sp.]|nr:hypothetical protein [Actinoplanes sp.]
MTRTALLAAPLAMTAYGITRIIGRLDGHYGPGPDWQLAHLFGRRGTSERELALRMILRRRHVRGASVAVSG